MTDPVKAIARHIRRRCRPFAEAELVVQHSVAWRSMLFDGARHRIELGFRGDALEQALERLGEVIGEADLAIAGHLVADLKLAAIARSGQEALVTLDALTIEDL